jgi:hypothetical protein
MTSGRGEQGRTQRRARGGAAWRRVAAAVCAVVCLSLLPGGAALRAQTRKTQTKKQPANVKARPKAQAKGSAQESPQDEVTRLRAEFVRLTKEYKQNLQQLLALQEKEVAPAEEKLKQMQSLYREGLLAQRDVEANEEALTAARTKAEATRQQITKADTQVAESLLEAEADELAARAPKLTVPAAPGRTSRVGSYVRYTGAGLWSLANAWKVQNFFQQQFGRQLPISAFGQTAVHNQLGYDHRNSMDVPVQPNSVEGQALMAFLRANGIPFTAFTAAIPGAATGPHIHIGTPSHRITPR